MTDVLVDFFHGLDQLFQPVRDWVKSAYFPRDFICLLIGGFVGVCVGVWIVTPRYR